MSHILYHFPSNLPLISVCAEENKQGQSEMVTQHEKTYTLDKQDST